MLLPRAPSCANRLHTDLIPSVRKLPKYRGENFVAYVAKSRGTVCSSSPYDVVNVWGITDELRMKFSQSRYGSFVFVGVLESGTKGGEPPVLGKQQCQ